MIRFALAAQPAPIAAQTYATILLSSHRSAQGPVVQRYRDGRVVIDTGAGRLAGVPLAHDADAEPAPIWSPLFAGMI